MNKYWSMLRDIGESRNYKDVISNTKNWVSLVIMEENLIKINQQL